MKTEGGGELQLNRKLKTVGQRILVGTAKGLVLFEKQKHWAIREVFFLGFPVAFVYVDPNTSYWWVGLAHRHWGPKLHRSKNEGQSWEEVKVPVYPQGTQVRKGKPAVLKKMWCMQAAGSNQPGHLWLGTEPGGLFVSTNNGDQFELLDSLWEHPSRSNEMQWFGAGRDFPFIHSIVVDPKDSQHLYIAVSCAGVFESEDGGRSWVPQNNGLVAAYLPNPYAEVGHDPHLLLQCQEETNVLWQQNHCGVFRAIDGGANWVDVSDRESGLADYGFALAIDPLDPMQAWVIPALSDEMRVAKDLALVVSHTKDGGKSWQALRNGLPQDNCFDIVFRHGFVYQNDLLVFGTNNGNLYLSENRGERWEQLDCNLARIDSVVVL